MKKTILSNGCTWTVSDEHRPLIDNHTVSTFSTPQTTGLKHDTGKPQLSLLPLEGLSMAAEALSYGAQKYSRGNYKGGLAHSRLLDAALRHINQYASGEAVDSESGLSHVSHALASLMMLAYMLKNRPDLDDLK